MAVDARGQSRKPRCDSILDGDIRWLVTKPFALGKSEQERIALLLNVFGGWLFYLTKRGATPGPGGLTDETMLESWAGFWANVLDGES